MTGWHTWADEEADILTEIFNFSYTWWMWQWPNGKKRMHEHRRGMDWGAHSRCVKQQNPEGKRDKLSTTTKSNFMFKKQTQLTSMVLTTAPGFDFEDRGRFIFVRENPSSDVSLVIKLDFPSPSSVSLSSSSSITMSWSVRPEERHYSKYIYV